MVSKKDSLSEEKLSRMLLTGLCMAVYIVFLRTMEGEPRSTLESKKFYILLKLQFLVTPV